MPLERGVRRRRRESPEQHATDELRQGTVGTSADGRYRARRLGRPQAQEIALDVRDGAYDRGPGALARPVPVDGPEDRRFGAGGLSARLARHARPLSRDAELRLVPRPAAVPVSVLSVRA